MFRWLLFATFLAVSLAEEEAAKEAGVEDLQAEESSHHAHYDRHYHDYGEDLPGTGVLREVIPSHHPISHKRIMEQDKIVYDRYSPTYYQPTWILDYRYLKTGGRDYVRGDGGQILILPKGIKAPQNEKKQFDNYDELLEFLRLKELAEREARHLHRSHHHDRHEKNHELEEEHQDVDIHKDPWGRKDHHKEQPGWIREHERESRRHHGDHDDHHHRDWHKKPKHHELHGWEKEAVAKWRH